MFLLSSSRIHKSLNTLNSSLLAKYKLIFVDTLYHVDWIALRAKACQVSFKNPRGDAFI